MIRLAMPLNRRSIGRLKLRHPTYGAAGGVGDLGEAAGFAEPARIHGGGERLEVRLPSQFVVEVLQSPCGIEQLRRSLSGLQRSDLAGATADESICARIRATCAR